jgi:hypothetical protein
MRFRPPRPVLAVPLLAILCAAGAWASARPSADARSAPAPSSAARYATQQKGASPAPATLPFAVAWDTPLDGPLAAAPAYDTTHAYLALGDSAEKPAQTVGLSLADGSVTWRRDLANVQSLAADNGLVFVATNTTLHALLSADGRPAWQFALDAPPVVPLIAVNGWLIVATEKSVVALSGREGTRVWQQPVPASVAAAPAVSGEGVYLGLADGRLLRLNVQSGAIVWTAHLAAPCAAILALEDQLLAGTKGRAFCALDPRNGHVRWRVRTGSDVVGMPLADGWRVYFISLDNLLRGVDRENGTLHARRVLTRRALFGPFRAGNLLLVSGMSPTIEGFRLPMLEPAGTFETGGTELGQGGLKLAAPVHVAPGQAEGQWLLVCVTGEGEVIALRPPAEKK